MEAADFWNDPDSANATIEEFRLLKTQTEGLEQAIGMLEDGQTALEMASEDEEFLTEADETLHTLEQHMEKVELQSLLSATTITETASSPSKRGPGAPRPTTGRK